MGEIKMIEKNYMSFDGCKYSWDLVNEYEIKKEYPMDEEILEELREEFIADGENPDDIYPFDVFYEKGQIFTNTEKNICLVFCQDRVEDEEWLDESSEILNVTFGDGYDNIVNYINTHTNFTVYWTQEYGTSADYVILEDFYNDTLTPSELDKQISEIINNSKQDHEGCYKYVIIHNGICSKFNGQ